MKPLTRRCVRNIFSRVVLVVAALCVHYCAKAQCYEDFYVYQVYPYGQLCSPQSVTLRAEYYSSNGYTYGEFRWYTSDTDPFPVQTTYIDPQFNPYSDYNVYATNGLTVWVSFYNYNTGCESYRQPYTFYISTPAYVYQDYATRCNYDVAKVQVSSNVSGVSFQLYKMYEYYDPYYGWVQDYQYQQSNSTGYFEIWDFDPADQYNYYVKVYQPYGCSTPYYYQLYFEQTGPGAPTVSGNLLVTSGSSTTLTASGNASNFNWYDASGNQISQGWQYTTPTTLTPNTYTYQVRGVSSDGSCLTDPSSVTVTVTYPTISYTAPYNSGNFTRSIDLSKPVGVVNGSSGTTSAGGVTYSVPVYTPPGTSGLQPSLSLVYNSQAGDGNVGYGWNISGLSTISRAGKTIFYNGSAAPVSYTNEDAFVLDGVRLNPISGTNGANGTIYATEAESFSKIVSNTGSSANNPDWFMVTTKAGIVMQYGNTQDSRVLSDDGLNVMLWRLNKITDVNGNYIEFKYDNSFRESKIIEISYTGNSTTGLAPFAKVYFDYGVRTDQNTLYDGGASLGSKTLLKAITVKHDAETVKTYQFNYAFDNVSSLLKEIIESGADGSSLNSTIFLYGDPPQNIAAQSTVNLTGAYDYFAGDFDADGKTDLMAANYYYDANNNKMHSQYKVITNLTSTSSSTLYTNVLPSGNAVQITEKKFFNFLTGDYNGDGRDDASVVNTSFEYIYPGGTRRTLTNVTINYTSSTGYNPAPFTTPWVYGANYRFISTKGNYFIPGDFDGNGNLDYILVLARKRTEYDPDPDDYFDFKAFLNSPGTGETNLEILNFGFGANPSPDFYAGTVALADMITPVDFDGDGKTDLLVTKDGQSYVLSIRRISAATGYSFYCSVLASTTEVVKNCKVFPGDFNGDKKTDLLVRNTNGSWKILYSNGKTFLAVPFGFNQSVNMTGTYSDDKIIVSDFNGDGKSDILHGFAVFVNGVSNSSKFSLYYARGANTGFYYEQYVYANVLGYTDFTVGDFNGDGRSDLVNHICSSCSTDFISFKAGGQERLLKKVTDGHNLTTAFDYKTLSDKTDPGFYNRTVSLDDPSNINPYNYIQLPVFVVSTVTAPNGIGGSSVTNFSYEDAILHRGGKGFLGFKKITAKNSATGLSGICLKQLNTQFALLYNVRQTVSLTSSGEVLNETNITNSFDNLSTGYLDKRFFQKVDKLVSANYLTGSATETLNTYDSYGNITTSVVNVGAPSGNSVSALESSTTTTSYGIHNTPVPAKPDQVTVTTTRNGAATQSSTTQYSYTGTGLVSSEVSFYGLPKAVTTSYGYNSLGNPTSVTVSAAGINARVSNYTYDVRGRFILSKQVGAGTSIAQTETFTFDGKWGKPLSKTSSDCITTQYEYDGYGRIKKTTDPIFTANQTLNWDVQNGNIYYGFTDYSGGKPDVKIWYDALGRETKKQFAGFNNQWLTTTTTYDARGNVASTTNSYYSNETPVVTTNSYDVYNRLQLVSNSLNSVIYTYNKLAGGNLQVVTTDQSGQTTSRTTDPTGKVVTSSDAGGDLSFTYDSRGGQTEVRHGGTTLITSVYDAYGRQTSVTDVNAGTRTFDYDAIGELRQQQDNLGHSYVMNYDDLGRIISRQGPEGLTTYEYYKDNATGCSNNNLSKITGFNGIVKELTYDNFKRLQSEKTTVDGLAYTTQYAYDSYSNVSKITYPSGVEVNNSYNNTGQLIGVTAGSPGAQTTVFTGSQMNGYGQYTSYTLANNKVSQITYQNGLPTRYYASNVQDLNLSWDFMRGNLLSRQDAIKGLTETFQFDGLNRLKQTALNGQVQLNLNYDGTSGFSRGNITSKTDAGDYTYKTDKIHAIAYIANPATFISHTEQTVSYTPFLKAQTITEAPYQLNITYGPDYERVKTQLTNNGTITETKYFLGDYEKFTDNTGTKEIHYIKGGDGLCAILVRQGGVNNFYVTYTDHLGSILTVTDLNSTVVAEQNFDPWGRKRNPQNWTYASVPSVPSWLYRGFTGHEMLAAFDLINMNGRIYDPVQGRMLSPDNYVPNPFNTQGYNRYAYGNNNPLSYVDANGNIIWFIIAGAALIGGVANGIAYSNQGRNFFDGFWRGALVGGAAALTGGAIAGALPGLGGAVLGGMAGGIVNGGLGNALNGGDIMQGIIFGAMTGAVGGGLGAYFGGGTGAFIGGAASGALGSALNGGNVLTGALVGGVTSFATYHAMNYYNYTRSSLKSVVRYGDFARMGGDFQRSLVRHEEFGGIVTDKGYFRAPAAYRHNFGIDYNANWLANIKGTPLFSFHTHWAKAGLTVTVNANNDFASTMDILLGNSSQGTTVYGPSTPDWTYATSSTLPGILMDRSGIFNYFINGSGGQTNNVLNRAFLTRFNFIYWPW